MSSRDIKILIASHHRRLQKLKEREAVEGMAVDPRIIIEIEDIEERIDILQSELEKIEYNTTLLSITNSTQNLISDRDTHNPIKTIPELPHIKDVIDGLVSKRNWDKVILMLNDDTLKSFYRAGEHKTLNSWFSKLPLSELEKNPRLLLWKGNILSNYSGELKQAMSSFNMAEELFHKQGDLVGVAKAQIWQSVGLRMMGKASQAVQLATEGLNQLNLCSDDQSLIAWATRNRGLAYGTSGDIVNAISDTCRALLQFQNSVNKYMEGLCFHDLGVSLEKQGSIGQAEYNYVQAVRIWRELGNSNDLVNSLTGLGNILNKDGRYDEALEKLSEVFEIATKIGITRRAAFAMQGIGNAQFGLKAYQEAIKSYEKSTLYAQEAEVQSLVVDNLIKSTESIYYLSLQYDLDKALAEAIKAEKIAKNSGLSLERISACMLQIKINISMERYDIDFQIFQKAADYFLTNELHTDMVEVELWWAYGLLLNDKKAESVEHTKKAVQLIQKIHVPLPNLERTVQEVHKLLFYFTQQDDTPPELKSKILMLISSCVQKI